MRYLTFVFALTLLIISQNTQAQASKNGKNNPLNSVHNYKHSGNAAYARENNLDNLQTFEYTKSEEQAGRGKAARNYKHQTGGTTTASAAGANVPVEQPRKASNALDSKANYKRQNVVMHD